MTGRERSDLRPTLAERGAGLEPARERIRRERRRQVRRRLLLRGAGPALAVLAFLAGIGVSHDVLALAAAAQPEHFAVRRLALRGAAGVDLRAALDAASPAPGTPLDAPLAATLARRLEQHPWIARAHAVALPPGTVLIAVEERRPVAVWSGAGTERPLLLDAEGVPFATAGAAELTRWPRLTTRTDPGAERESDLLASGVALLRALTARGWAPVEIALAADDATHPVLHLAGVPAAVRLGAGDREARLARLSRALVELPESRAAASIDVRFAGQVVLVDPPQDGGGGVRDSDHGG